MCVCVWGGGSEGPADKPSVTGPLSQAEIEAPASSRAGGKVSHDGTDSSTLSQACTSQQLCGEDEDEGSQN